MPEVKQGSATHIKVFNPESQPKSFADILKSKNTERISTRGEVTEISTEDKLQLILYGLEKTETAISKLNERIVKLEKSILKGNNG